LLARASYFSILRSDLAAGTAVRQSGLISRHFRCRHADNILVAEARLVVESGRHDELLRKGGRYASFYRLQPQLE
jgi:hypothetical protein